MNSTQIFEMALGLEKPWLITKIDMVKPESGGQGQLDIYLDFEKGFKFPGGKTDDTVERTWQHLNFFQHTCFLHARVPQVQTSEGSTRMVNVSWARPGSGFTLLFEAFSMLLIESEMSVSKAADIINAYGMCFPTGLKRLTIMIASLRPLFWELTRPPQKKAIAT
jgi:hypothetical protein